MTATVTELNFLSVRNEILRRRRHEPRALRRCGIAREVAAKRALLIMKREGTITDFMPTGDLSLADLQGIDFYVVVIERGRRVVRRLSVTGSRWVARTRRQHPEVSVVDLEPQEDIRRVKKKLIKALTLIG